MSKDLRDHHICATGGIVGHFICAWTIKNFSSLGNQVGRFYDSDRFKLEEAAETAWNMRIYPAGATPQCSEFISCYLSFIANRKSGVEVQYSMSFRNQQGDELAKSQSKDRCILLPNEGVGSLCLKERKLVLEGLAKDDVLVIQCTVSYADAFIRSPASTSFIADVSPYVKLVDDMKSLSMNKELADSVVSVEGTDIPIHTWVLRARSDVFDAMFKPDTAESINNRVVFPDFGKDTVVSLLQYVYTGIVDDITIGTALDLVRAGDMYAMNDLILYCSNFLILQIGHENVIKLLVQADVFGVKELRRAAIEFICKNWSSIDLKGSRQMLELRPGLMFDVMEASQCRIKLVI